MSSEPQRANDGSAEASAERYRDLFDLAPDAVLVVGHDSNLQLVNTRAVELFGYPHEELVGRSVAMLVPQRFRAGHAADAARFLANPVAQSLSGGRAVTVVDKKGSEFPVDVNVRPIATKHGLIVSISIRDTSERTRFEAPGKLIADRLASAVESIQDAVALFDAANRLVLCNSVYRMLIGQSMEGPLIGRSYEELLDAWIGDIAFPDDSERARFRRSRLEQRKHDEPTSLDLRMRDGRTLRVIDRRTADGGIVKTIWDLTDDVRLAEEVRAAHEIAEAASRAKSDFLSSMSHELRTPMNAILGFAQLLQRDKKEPLSLRHRERVDHILKGGEHLLRLIDDVLDLSRIDAGAVSISTEPVRVSDVLDEVTATLESMAARASVTVRVTALPAGLPMVTADRTRFVQVLTNFGSNAIKYNHAGGALTFTVSLIANQVRVLVADNGLGIAAEHHAKLFQPFQRAGQETGPIEGTGIGLVISKRLAELMRGRVGFRSVVGEGSEFWIELPVDAATPRAAPASPAVDASSVRFRGEGRRLVLYVEDNNANVEFMRDLVSGFENLELLTAPTAEIGVGLARTRRPEAIVMDINLPGMSGLDALRILRGLAETRDIPIIALSAAASARDRRLALEAGFYRYLTKPVKVDEFIDALEGLLRPGPHPSAPAINSR